MYNPNVKNALVIKAYDVISHGRLEFDAQCVDIIQSFTSIRRTTTGSGNRPTYEARAVKKADTLTLHGQRCMPFSTNH
nr:hypothetical protein [Proteus mirabilis]